MYKRKDDTHLFGECRPLKPVGLAKNFVLLYN